MHMMKSDGRTEHLHYVASLSFVGRYLSQSISSAPELAAPIKAYLILTDVLTTIWAQIVNFVYSAHIVYLLSPYVTVLFIRFVGRSA